MDEASKLPALHFTSTTCAVTMYFASWARDLKQLLLDLILGSYSKSLHFPFRCQRIDTVLIYLGGYLFVRPVMEALWLINHSSGRGASAESWFLAFRREGDYSKHIFWVLLCGPHIINSPVIAFHLLWGNRAKGYDITQDLPIIKFYQWESTKGG